MCDGAGGNNAVTNQAAGGGNGHTGHDATLDFQNAYNAANGLGTPMGTAGGSTFNFGPNGFEGIEVDPAGHSDNGDLKAYEEARLEDLSTNPQNMMSLEDTIQAVEDLGFSDAFGMSAAEAVGLMEQKGVNAFLREDLGVEGLDAKFDGEDLNRSPLERQLDYTQALSSMMVAAYGGGGDASDYGDMMEASLGLQSDVEAFRGNDRVNAQNGAQEVFNSLGAIAAGNGFNGDWQSLVGTEAWTGVSVNATAAHDTSGHNGLSAEANNGAFVLKHLHLGGDAAVSDQKYTDLYGSAGGGGHGAH